MYLGLYIRNTAILDYSFVRTSSYPGGGLRSLHALGRARVALAASTTADCRFLSHSLEKGDRDEIALIFATYRDLQCPVRSRLKRSVFLQVSQCSGGCIYNSANNIPFSTVLSTHA